MCTWVKKKDVYVCDIYMCVISPGFFPNIELFYLSPIAYELLSCPDKRRLYDSVDDVDDTVPSAPKDLNDFYRVFGPVFARNAKCIRIYYYYNIYIYMCVRMRVCDSLFNGALSMLSACESILHNSHIANLNQDGLRSSLLHFWVMTTPQLRSCMKCTISGTIPPRGASLATLMRSYRRIYPCNFLYINVCIYVCMYVYIHRKVSLFFGTLCGIYLTIVYHVYIYV